jgi:hypothetical protein
VPRDTQHALTVTVFVAVSDFGELGQVATAKRKSAKSVNPSSAADIMVGIAAKGEKKLNIKGQKQKSGMCAVSCDENPRNKLGIEPRNKLRGSISLEDCHAALAMTAQE